MALPVSDTVANRPESIAEAAKIIGRSKRRRKIFAAIYRGKRDPKPVSDLMKATGLSRVEVLQCGKQLRDEQLVEQAKINGETAYKKIGFYQKNRDRILRFVKNPKSLERLVTKRNVRNGFASITVPVPRKRVSATRITIDDIPSFNKIRRISNNVSAPTLPESKIKAGIARIIGEGGRFKDWGGERFDLSTTRFSLAGKRKQAVFAFKGPATKGHLTPGKMGKNGDQIQRLVTSPGDVFLIQYHGEIGDYVREQLQQFAQLKSVFEDRRIWYGVIDGQDTRRLIRAYPKEFGLDLKQS